MISVSPQKTIRFLGVIIASLSLINLAVNFARCFLGRGGLWGISRLFDLDIENNIPTWYASVTLLICAGLLALITHRKRQQGDRFMNHWRGLALIFLWLSMDEAASVHELFIDLNKPLQTTGFLHYAWVIPAMVILGILAVVYQKFVMALPQQVKRRFLLAISLYVAGGLVLEMVGGQYKEVMNVQMPIANGSGLAGMGMALILAAEEMLEMSGVAVLIYTLLQMLSRESHGFHIAFGNLPRQAEPKVREPAISPSSDGRHSYASPQDER
ncbi:MAG: hypothetical protein NW220_21060 [Leptolyngbyaceae cyanobacterium bins.349]|nr:hypothetical protein [Leptolyngbyaceae cyanobacterium bins.349]